MNKRILCLVIALLLLIPFVLTSCKKELTEQEIMDKISNSGATALTLSIWIPTNSDVDDTDFIERVNDVEEAINVILRDKNYSTKIDLVVKSNEEYESQLANKFGSIAENIASGEKLPSIISGTYVNTTNKVPIGNSYFYELNYPSVLPNQVDIFYIRDYNNYRDYVSSGYVQKLDSYLDKIGGTYRDLAKCIKSEFLTAMKVDGNTYAIPNNHQYADTYQYILIDKAIFDGQDKIDIESIKDIYSCKEFINLVGQSNQSGVVPFVGTIEDAPNFVDFDNSSLVGATINGKAPSNVFEIQAYTQYVAMYKELQESSYVKAELANGEKAAVSFFYGSNVDAKAYENDYYLIKSEMPVASEESLFESAFAISKYSADYDRAMKVLYLLQTDSKIVTLLQYGIEDEDYEIEVDDKTLEEKFVIDKDTKYDMSSLNIGNGYMTYKENGVDPNVDAWQDVKDINYDTVITPYLGFLYNYNNNATDEEKAQLETLKAAVATLVSEVKADVENMSAEEYKAFVKLYNVDIKAVDEKIEKLGKELFKDGAELTDPTEEELQKLNEYNELVAQKTAYEANATVVKLHSSKDYQSLLELYAKLESSYN